MILAFVFACADNAVDKTLPQNDSCDLVRYFIDSDGDGFGNPYRSIEACVQPSDHVTNFGDCDDSDPNAYPDALWFRDVDGDGYGDSSVTLSSCPKPVGYIQVEGDCDDFDGTRYPGAVWYADTDGDGFGDPASEVDSCGDVAEANPQAGDCDDANVFIHPDANEICDFIDNDCDTLIDDEDDGVDIYTQVPFFEDSDGDGFGSDISIGQYCPSSTVGSMRTGDCNDTDPLVYPHRLDFIDDIDSDCDGEETVFVVSSAEGGWIGNITSASFGVAVRSKDLDGDNKNELLVGTYNANDYAGGLRFIPGQTAGDRTAFPVNGRSWDGTVLDEKAGFSLEFIGDWNGDGVEDIAVGAPYYNESMGQVYLLSVDHPEGSFDGSIHQLTWDTDDSFAGWSMLGIDDLNGDGKNELLISVRKDDRSGNNRGSIVLVYGGDTDTPVTEHHALFGASNGNQFGFAMAPLEDADGDGIQDIVVSAPYRSDVVTSGGAAYLLSVSDLTDTSLFLEDREPFYGIDERSYVGIAVSSAGDFNGDGLSDILLGASHLDSPTDVDVGGAYVVHGSNVGWTSHSLADSALTFYGAVTDDRTGRYVSLVGDIDGDSKSDVGVCAHASDAYYNNAGMYYVLLGGRTGTVNALDADMMIVGESSNDQIGRGVALAGDHNGDGLSDFWVGSSSAGAYGALYLLEGVAAPE